MANIRKTEPSRQVRPFDPFEPSFDDLFRGLFVRPMSLGSQVWGEEQRFRIDVTEHEKEYRVHAEIPGVRKEDINVTIDGDEVAISAEAKRESEAKDKEGRVLHSERFAGRMFRAFSLGHEVDQSKAQAKYVDGVLELTLPKLATAEAKRKQIPIH